MNIKSRIESGEYISFNQFLFTHLVTLLNVKKKRAGGVSSSIVSVLLLASISIGGYIISFKVENIGFDSNAVVPYFISALYIAVLMLITEKMIGRLLVKLEDEIAPALKDAKDIESLSKRLSIMFARKNQVYFGIFFSLGIHFLFIAPNMNLIPVYGWGIIVANIILNFFHGVCVYFVYSYAYWAFNELREYDFSLFPLDPSSSETIRILSGILNYVLYTVIVMITVITVFFVVFNIFTRISIIITLVIMWITATTIFSFNQLILARIIQKSKWKALNEIQAEIMELRTKEVIPSPETLAHIEKLVTLHNTVRATPNSALNFRSLLEFLNSLFLPTVGVLISTIKDVEGFVRELIP